MHTVGLLALTFLFALLAFDTWRLRVSGDHIWEVPRRNRIWDGDYLSREAQDALQSERMTAKGGIQGLHWVFAGLSLACAAAALWNYVQ